MGRKWRRSEWEMNSKWMKHKRNGNWKSLFTTPAKQSQPPKSWTTLFTTPTSLITSGRQLTLFTTPFTIHYSTLLSHYLRIWVIPDTWLYVGKMIEFFLTVYQTLWDVSCPGNSGKWQGSTQQFAVFSNKCIMPASPMRMHISSLTMFQHTCWHVVTW